MFATGLNGPFGIAFYPSGDNPQWVYVANVDSVVRFPYRSGDIKARGARRNDRRQSLPAAAATRRATSRSRRTARRCSSRSAPTATSPKAWRGSMLRSEEMDRRKAARRDVGQRIRTRRRAGVRSAGQEPPHLRDRHPQLRRHGDRSRRPATCGARPTSAICSATISCPTIITRVRDGALLRLALVLHRRQRRSAPQGRAARPQGQGHGAGYPDPAALGFAAA